MTRRTKAQLEADLQTALSRPYPRIARAADIATIAIVIVWLLIMAWVFWPQ
jgi:hypothetical protein